MYGVLRGVVRCVCAVNKEGACDAVIRWRCGVVAWIDCAGQRVSQYSALVAVTALGTWQQRATRLQSLHVLVLHVAPGLLHSLLMPRMHFV